MEVENIKENQEDHKNKVIEIIKEYSVVIQRLFIMFCCMINALLYVINYDYAQKAAVFYGIPSGYFFNSIVDDKVLGFGIIVLYFIILGSPFIFKNMLKNNKLSKWESASYSTLTSIVTFSVLLIFSENVIEKFKISISINIIFVIDIIITLLTWGLYFYLFLKVFDNIKGENQKEKREIEREKNNNASKKNIKKKEENGIIINVTVIIFSVVMTIHILTMPILVLDKILAPPELKKYYEIIELKDTKNNIMAVVSYKNGKAILMECEIMEDENRNLKLKKGRYYLKSIEGYPIEYKKFDEVRCEY